jgi:hypothetical protein
MRLISDKENQLRISSGFGLKRDELLAKIA